MARALFLIYEDYAEFEVHLASLFLKSKGFVIETFSIDDERKPIKGTSGFHSYPDRILSSIDCPDDYDVFIIPGGNVFPVLENETLLNLVRRIHENGGLIGGICAGTILPSKAGLLDGKKFSTELEESEENYATLHDWSLQQKEDVTVDDRIVTAPGRAYVEFASTIIQELNLFDDGEKIETLDYFKNQRSS